MTLTNESLIVIISLAASTLAGYLRQDGLPDYLNAAFSGLFLILAAVASVLVAGKLSPDVWQDATLVAAQVAFIYLGAGKVLEGFLQIKVNASPAPTPVLTPRASVLSSAASSPSAGSNFVRPAQSPPSAPTGENDLGG